jgi:alpha-L-fucosidase
MKEQFMTDSGAPYRSSGRLSRRALLSAAAGGAAAAAAAPVVAGLSGLVPESAAWAAEPTQAKLRKLVDMRFGMFLHFNMGTFTDEEWASPNRDPRLFAPSAVDCGQWAAAAAAARMSYGVLTTKHHDGFCLWPSKHTNYTVANSSYKQDIVAQYVDAFRSRGLKVGFYYSIWDRSHTVQAYDTRHSVPASDAIQPGDITYIRNQLTELLTNYGPIDLLITDGYSWQMGQQAVPYQQIRDLVKSLQPNTVMIDIGGLVEPWLGDAIFFEEPLGVTAPAGNTYAGLQGQTISNGWFWHPSTPTESLMSRNSVLDHLADLEPKWTSLILNCPPNRDGRLDTNVVKRLAEVGAAWKPIKRGPLPAQPLRVEYPVTPVNAYATKSHSGEGPLRAIDGLSDVRFETCWSTWNLPLPQSITIDLGGVWGKISTLEYLPKQWNRKYLTDGDITSYTISTSLDGTTFTQVAAGTWAGDATTKFAEWSSGRARFVRLTATAGTGDYANVSGLQIGGRSAKPVLVKRQFEDAGAAFRLAARHSGMVATITGSADGANIQQGSWKGANDQKWSFIGTGDGYYKIRNVASGKLMEVAGLSRANGGKVALWHDADAPQQHWAVTPIGDGYHLLTNRLSGLSLDVSGASTTEGADIHQWDYQSVPQQQWRIVAS